MEEIEQAAGDIPFFLYGVKSTNKVEISSKELDKLKGIYFETKDIKVIWTRLADEMFQFVTGLSINNPQYRTYVESFKKSKKLLQSILKSLGLKVNENFVDIFNRHGLFSVDLASGKTYYEPISCSDCNHRNGCNKKKKKFLCIVQKNDFSGWSNTDLSKDDMLVLSKIFAISEDNLPEDVYQQIAQQEKTCLP